MSYRDKTTAAGFFEETAGSYYEERYGDRSDINTFGMLNRMNTVLALLDKYSESSGVCLDMGCDIEGPATEHAHHFC